MDPEIDPLTGEPVENGAQEPVVPRGEPQIDEARKALVEKLTDCVKADKKHWSKAFKRMREDQDFAYGRQWSENDEDGRYVANIVLRHVQQRVAALYAKNPRTVARVKPRLLSTVWDGTASSIMSALEQVAMLTQSPGGLMSPEMAKNMGILQEAQQVTEQRRMLDNFAKTLELLYEHNVSEQAHPFKTMMKLAVRRAVTTGVGYVKLGFQRAMAPDPDVEGQISDTRQQLATIERLSADIADGELPDETSAEIERLRLMLADLQSRSEVIVREGLVFDYPASTSIIPEKSCRSLREFLGCKYVTQEYFLTVDQVQEIYGVDVSKKMTAYSTNPQTGETSPGGSYGGTDEDAPDGAFCAVWEVWHKADNLVYVICDGHPDFLREPAAPETWTERFYPWFSLVLNECDHPEDIYPPSDVRLLRHQQLEYNRLREGLKEHRNQNRPLTVASSGILSEDDKEILKTRPAGALVELDGLMPQQRVNDVLQPMGFPGVDPNLYEVNPVFEDVLRTVGVQEANLGGATGNTATETSIAESSRMSSIQSNIDELDDLLSQMARTGGQILLSNVSEEVVREIVGPGAVWPTMSREQLAKEVFLEIEAGSTGRPNQAQEIQNFERLAPIIMQIPGVKPEKLAREAIRRLDDKLQLEDFFDDNIPSISALNQMMGASAGGPQQTAGPNAPAQQGAQGMNNAETPDRTAGAPGGPDMPVGGPPPGMPPM